MMELLFTKTLLAFILIARDMYVLIYVYCAV